MTDGPPHILAALDGIMNDVNALGKDGFNKQQSFPFRSHDGVIDALGPAFRQHKVIPAVQVTSQERRPYQTKTGTNMMESLVKITYTLTSLVDGSEHVVGRDIPGEAADAGDKSLTKAVTVACRVALIHGFAIPTHAPDPDETITEQGPPEKAPEPISKDQADLMETVTKKLDDVQRAELNDWYKAQRLPKKENLSEDQADKVLLKMAEIMKTEDVEIDPETGEILNSTDPF